MCIIGISNKHKEEVINGSLLLVLPFAVFKNILGDTILIDDLDSANNYRRAVSGACC